LNHWTLHVPTEEAIKTVNRKLKGWSAYFHYGQSTKAFCALEGFVCKRVRRWLWKRHKSKGNPYERYPNEVLYQQYKLWKLPTWAAWKRA